MSTIFVWHRTHFLGHLQCGSSGCQQQKKARATLSERSVFHCSAEATPRCFEGVFVCSWIIASWLLTFWCSRIESHPLARPFMTAYFHFSWLAFFFSNAMSNILMPTAGYSSMAWYCALSFFYWKLPLWTGQDTLFVYTHAPFLLNWLCFSVTGHDSLLVVVQCGCIYVSTLSWASHAKDDYAEDIDKTLSKESLTKITAKVGAVGLQRCCL